MPDEFRSTFAKNTHSTPDRMVAYAQVDLNTLSSILQQVVRIITEIELVQRLEGKPLSPTQRRMLYKTALIAVADALMEPESTEV